MQRIVVNMSTGEISNVSLTEAEVAEISARRPGVVAAVWCAIKGERERRTMTGGYFAAGKWWHSDQLSRSQQSDMFLAGSLLPAGIMWKTMDGSFVEMTPAIAAEVFVAKAASDQAIFVAAEAHRIAMEAAENPSTYDFSGGWPKVFGEQPPPEDHPC